ncbi:MAG: aspartyl/asparaginyl beta-hydroxylase domain-containing protein, partial [Pusillimonas sp.]
MAEQDKEVQSHIAAIVDARRRGDRDAEIHHLDAALVLAPQDPQLLNTRGMRCLQDAEWDQAATFFLDAANRDPGEPALWVNLATARRAMGDVEGERAALERALANDRFHFIALLRKAELEERAGSEGDAVVSWSAVLQVGRQISDAPLPVLDAIRRGEAFMAHHARDLAERYDEAFGADRASNPDMRRFDRCLDIVLGRKTVFRNECHGLYYPFLPADEYFDKRLFPWLSELEAAAADIRREGLALVEQEGEDLRPYVRMDEGSPDSKWTPLDGSLDWGACFLWEYGRPNQRVLDRCPATAAALARAPLAPIPGKAPSAFFSQLKAGAHIPPHTGVTNTRAIIHLPLVVPPGCEFRVGGETRAWVEGEAFAFDDTIEHEAINRSDRNRLILIFDVWNPHLTEREQMLI